MNIFHRRQTPQTKNAAVLRWVKDMADLCTPDLVVWCDGSKAERRKLTAECLLAGELIELNREKLPGCTLHRSAPGDVARTEKCTFICSRLKEDAGPTNNWMEPVQAHQKLKELFQGCMKGRIMYVVPFVMGVPGSRFRKVGIELTDSRYVVLNMGIMTRMGQVAWDELGDSDQFTRGLHSTGDLDEKHRMICHFPEDNAIWSIGSGYGGNALLGKKCLSLRIASVLARKEGWLAEHMLIMGVENPQKQVHYLAAAFPSACGKTNLAMLVPPAALAGYKIWTVGDDIAWLRPGADGRLWASNPEHGFFGVVPGTNSHTNPNAMRTIDRNTIYTNVALRPDGTVWWEGHDDAPPAEAVDWQGRKWTPNSPTLAAHANSRFTAPLEQCPALSPAWDDPAGVPLDAIVFGGRRDRVAPLVYETFNWAHGVFTGATMASEITAAQTGAVGKVRRDPMAMLPFCGYNMADYFAHWLHIEKTLKRPPKIFHVNWFRKNSEGRLLWPGFGDNLRVLLWILDRAKGEGAADWTPIGQIPPPEALDLRGLDLPQADVIALLAVDKAEWKKELIEIDQYLDQFGGDLSWALRAERSALEERLENSFSLAEKGAKEKLRI